MTCSDKANVKLKISSFQILVLQERAEKGLTNGVFGLHLYFELQNISNKLMLIAMDTNFLSGLWDARKFRVLEG